MDFKKVIVPINNFYKILQRLEVHHPEWYLLFLRSSLHAIGPEIIDTNPILLQTEYLHLFQHRHYSIVIKIETLTV